MSCAHCAGNLFGTAAPSPTLPAEAPAAHGPSDTVFFGGTVITMDDRNPAVDAVAVAGGKIVAVGAKDEVLAQAGAGAQRVNLAGQTLMPGLIDPHQHPLPGGLMLAHTMSVSYDVYKTKAEVLDALRKKASQ